MTDHFRIPRPDEHFQAHAVLAVETAPGHILWFQVALDHQDGCEVDIWHENGEEIHVAEREKPIYLTGTRKIRARIEGEVVSNREGWQPHSRADVVRPLPTGVQQIEGGL